MANLHLVTGYAGEKHITSSDQGSFNAAVYTEGQYVMGRGKLFDIEVLTNNSVRIFDGDAIMQGRHIRMKENTSVDLNFDNGTQGKKRIDLVVIRYTMEPSTGIEECNLAVKKGELTDNEPVAPVATHGDILNEHAVLNEMPLYQIPFDGLYIQEPIKLFEIVPSIKAVEDEIRRNLNKYAEQTFNRMFEILAEKQDVYKIYNILLEPGKWTGTTDNYRYRIDIDRVTPLSDVSVLLSDTATVKEAEEWTEATVMTASQGEGFITLKSYGNKPTVNIPIVVMVGDNTVPGGE